MKLGLLSALAVALAMPAAALASDEHQSANAKRWNAVVAQANPDSTSTKTPANGKAAKKARNKKAFKSGARTSKSEVKTETSSDSSKK